MFLNIKYYFLEFFDTTKGWKDIPSLKYCKNVTHHTLNANDMLMEC